MSGTASMAEPAPKAQPVFARMRSLRMRLTLSYLLLFALVLVGVGLAFRQALIATLKQQSEQVLDGEWSALRAYLRIHSGELVWAFDPEDPDESYAVERLRRIFLLTDTRANVLEVSAGYTALGVESPGQIAAALASPTPITVWRHDRKGLAFMVRMGHFRDQGHEFFVSIGLPMADTLAVPDRMLRVYFLVLPVVLLALIIPGWIAAGGALQPVEEVAAAAQTVSAGNLGLRIPLKGSGDELDALIETFNGMLERLEQNFQQIRQFSIDASHELRTPITSIRGQLEVALFSAGTKEEYRDAIVTAMQDVERLGQIVKSLLNLAQAESGQIVLNPTPISLPEFLAEQVSQYRIAADEKHIGISLHSPTECAALVDRPAFGRMVACLLSNAVQYTQDGGHVEVTLERGAKGIRLRVADNGPGIPAVHLPRVFDRFYRIREGERGGSQGAGLGLAYAAWAARAHGGSIEAHSEPGHGAEFIVTLPAQAQAPPASAAVA